MTTSPIRLSIKDIENLIGNVFIRVYGGSPSLESCVKNASLDVFKMIKEKALSNKHLDNDPVWPTCDSCGKSIQFQDCPKTDDEMHLVTAKNATQNTEEK